jgi:hypothetical protein
MNRIKSWLLRAALASVTLLSLVLPAAQHAAAAGRCYVKYNAGGLNNGTSWANAYRNLQSALGPSLCTEIWVAKGTYKTTTGTNRNMTFVLKNGVKIYGGFAGAETLPTQRNPALNVTVLSGAIGAAGDGDNAFHVVKGGGTDGTARLDGFTITGGHADGIFPNNSGAGIYVYHGKPALANLVVSANAASYLGGGMFNDGSSPAMTHVTFRSNTAPNGGGMYNLSASSPSLTNMVFNDNAASDLGGAMFNDDLSNPKMVTVTFSANQAGTDGGAIYNYNSSPFLATVTLSGNHANQRGGAIINDQSSPKLADVVFQGNDSIQGAGMFNTAGSNPALSHVTFRSNLGAWGGGMYNENSTPALADVTFTSNEVNNSGGGMINVNSHPTLTRVIFSGNHAPYGAGLYNQASSPTITDAVFSGNISEQAGGGMYNFNGSPTLTNVTFSANQAGTDGGGMFNYNDIPILHSATFYGNSAARYGGAMLNNNGDPVLSNVTFSGNTAGPGSAGAMHNTASSGPILVNNILYGDSPVEIVNDASSPGISDSVLQGGCGTMSCVHVIDADPLLGPLQNNGGFTPTVALGAGSPAIDTASNDTCTLTDQRGYPRPQDGNNDGLVICDMGAYEPLPLKNLRSIGAQDGWVLESGETTGVGGTLDAGAQTLRLGDDNLDRQYRSILSFNTGVIPDDAVVTRVTLKIKKAGLVGTNPFTTHGNILVDLRRGAFSGSAPLQAGDFQAAATATGVLLFTNTPVNNWYARSLAPTGFAYLNKAGVTQFRLRFQLDDNDDLSADILTFFSGNYATASARPLLQVEYYIP